MKSSFLFFLIVLGILQGTVACTKLVPPANEDPEPIEDEGATAIVNAPYTWGNLPVGGGGYVTGMVIHPVEENRMYIRTDVGGAYRWSEEEKKWIQLLEQHSTRVDGIALDLRLPDRVYIALNDGVYRSDNRGEEWTKLFSATYDGNGDLRWVGECIAVDPLNSDVIYTGTRKDGLYRSVDSGTSWSKIATVPSGTQGARAIVFGSTIQPQNQLSVVYVAVPTLGIYQSSDGGQTFSPLQDAPVYPNRMQYIAGKLYVTHDKGVAVWDGNGWTDITPAGGAGKNYCGLTVDLHDPNKIVVSQRYGTFNNPMYRSADGGQVWTQINTSSSSVIKDYNVPWWPDRWFSSATASLAFDPFHSGALYFTDWFGVTFTTDIWASGKVRFTTPLKGLEETVVLTLTAPSSGASVYSGLADIFGFCHENVQDYPAKRFYETNEGYSIAFCETAPQHIAILGASSNNGVGTTLMATTNDFGESWVSRALPAGAVLGRIAISATNPDKMVYVDGRADGAVYYTVDRGNTWTAATGAPTGVVNARDVWSKTFSLAADAVDGNLFYIFKSGYMYTSVDGGKTWTQKNGTAIPGKASYLYVAARPGKSGEVWVSLEKNGLYKSTDAGATFVKVPALSESHVLTWGAPVPGTDIPTVFSYGISSGVTGLYRSVDLGENWTKIDGDMKFPAGVKALAGDRQVFGRIYIGTGGMGILYGQPDSSK